MKQGDIESLRSVLDRVSDDLFAINGVTGVGIGPKYVSGHSTDTVAIRVYVREKRRHVLDSERIPASIDGATTDVVEADYSNPPLGTISESPAAEHADPVFAGAAIGSTGIPTDYGGTLGAFLRPNSGVDSIWALTAAHVLIGDGVYEPFSSRDVHDLLATVGKRFVGGNVECGYGTVIPLGAEGFRKGVHAEPLRLGGKFGEPTDPAVGMQVKMAGAKTGLTFGVIDDVDAVFRYDEILLHKQIRIQSSIAEAKFADPGDSGAVVVTADDKRQPVGLLWGGFFPSGVGVASHISEVLTVLDAHFMG